MQRDLLPQAPAAVPPRHDGLRPQTVSQMIHPALKLLLLSVLSRWWEKQLINQVKLSGNQADTEYEDKDSSVPTGKHHEMSARLTLSPPSRLQASWEYPCSNVWPQSLVSGGDEQSF